MTVNEYRGEIIKLVCSFTDELRARKDFHGMEITRELLMRMHEYNFEKMDKKGETK